MQFGPADRPHDYKMSYLSPEPSSLRDCPEILYHYTNQKGLLGILKERAIWATHSQYLNDRKEYLHAQQLALQTAEALLKKSWEEGNDARRKALEKIAANLSVGFLASFNICITSFSEGRDSLSQWRAYGGSSGYAIGFDSNRMRELATENGWQFVKCVYRSEDQKALILEMLDEQIKALLSPETLDPSKFDGITSEQYHMIASLNRHAPMLKDPHFEAEQEWRLISPALDCKSDNFCYREGRSLVVPYFKFRVAEKNQEFPIKSIIIGPTPDESRSKSSIRGLLVKHRVADTWNPEVENSRIPFREW